MGNRLKGSAETLTVRLKYYFPCDVACVNQIKYLHVLLVIEKRTTEFNIADKIAYM